MVVPLVMMEMRGIHLDGKTTNFCQVKWNVQMAMVPRAFDSEDLDPSKHMIKDMSLGSLTPGGKV